MAHNDRDRVLALAGVFQAAALVQDLAQRGQTDPQAAEASLASLLHIDAPDTDGVFGGVGGVRRGLEVITRHLLNPSDQELTRYVVGLLVLERKLARRPQVLEALRRGVEDAAGKRAYFGGMHESLIAHLADLYQRTISGLSPRIMVSGERGHLTNPATANRIRAMLLAGIRAAVLWRQCGGSRWMLVLQRKRLVGAARLALAEA